MSAPTPPPISGVKSVLAATGIPVSWLSKKPRLPSRNWLIFLSLTSSVTGYYIYDRRQCKKIRSAYVERVKHLAEEPMPVMASARKVRVYGCKWPGDEDHEQSLKYFRKYVKPILVAAAVDYEMINGQHHGDLTRKIADEIKANRRLELGIDTPPDIVKVLPTYTNPADRRKRELAGGTIIMGRPTFKEFMEGTRRGWSDPLDIVDREELLATELQNDGHFDEVPSDDASSSTSEHQSKFPSPKTSPVFSVLQSHPPQPTQPQPPKSTIPPSLNAPPKSIPPQPPLLLVPFTDHIGFTQIPYMLWDFFNQRRKVQQGSAAAYALIRNETRPIVGPPPQRPQSTASREPLFSDITNTTNTNTKEKDQDQEPKTDLTFDAPSETYFKSSLSSHPSTLSRARTTFYTTTLPTQLAATRSLTRGEREPTKDEVANPPMSEAELHALRVRKEGRWRRDEEGWEVVRRERGVVWDERFRGAFRVFVWPGEGEGKERKEKEREGDAKDGSSS